MKIVSPVEFKQAYQRVAEQNGQEMLRCWTSAAQYTALIRTRVLPAIAQELGLEAYSHKDYYWLDAVFYEERDTVHFGPDEVYAEYLAVALEHENTPFAKGCDTAVEINKLQLFNAPLKVLITFADGMKAQQLLGKYAKIMAGADVFSDFSTERRQLVIFGPPGSGRPARLNWTFHVYEHGAFTSI